MKIILPILAVSILVLGGLGAVAHDEAKKSIEIVEVKGGIGHFNIAIENTGDYKFKTLE